MPENFPPKDRRSLYSQETAANSGVRSVWSRQTLLATDASLPCSQAARLNRRSFRPGSSPDRVMEGGRGFPQPGEAATSRAGAAR